MSCIELEIKDIPLNETPSRKRRRETDKYNTPAAFDSQRTCFTNAGFSSTPKILIGRRRKAINVNTNNSCLEIKSIADAVNKNTEPLEQTINPFEVVRKPPKKKKRQADKEEACFENAALNLEVPDKQFNPFEVVRSETALTPKKSKGFVNAALNIRGQDVSAARNPYEIPRSNAVENLSLEHAAAMPCGLELGLPFTPTLGCRIDFQNISLSQLTPSKLLAEKLVFSPIVAPKRSLDAISEESTKDISKELDCYQLELENSINEAKLRKNSDGLKCHKTECEFKLDVQQKITFTQKLTNIVETNEEQEQEEEEEQISTTNISITVKKQLENSINNECNLLLETNAVGFASESEEDDIDFKTAAPFVRAYRGGAQTAARSISKESLNSQKSINSAAAEEKKKHLNVKNLIRKSIRKLMHPLAHSHAELPEQHCATEKTDKSSNILSSLRHSFRRKPHKQPLLVEDTTDLHLRNLTTSKSDISIVDTSERTMKLRSNEYAKIDELEKQPTLRQSWRHSTRGLGHQIMKNVFHKDQEKYAFRK